MGPTGRMLLYPEPAQCPTPGDLPSPSPRQAPSTGPGRGLGGSPLVSLLAKAGAASLLHLHKGLIQFPGQAGLGLLLPSHCTLAVSSHPGSASSSHHLFPCWSGHAVSMRGL